MSKEAMKLALEALVYASSYCDTYDAITAMREALAKPDFWEGYVPEPDKRQQALDKMAENARELGLDYEPAQQEPVATITITQRGPIRIIDNNFDDCVRDWPDGEYKLYTSSQPAQRKPLPYNKEDMKDLDVNQRLAFKLGWKSAEEAHGIKENT